MRGVEEEVGSRDIAVAEAETVEAVEIIESREEMGGCDGAGLGSECSELLIHILLEGVQSLLYLFERISPPRWLDCFRSWSISRPG